MSLPDQKHDEYYTESDNDFDSTPSSSSDEDDEEEYVCLDGDNRKRKSSSTQIQRLSVTVGLNFDDENDHADISNQYKVLLDSSTDKTRAIFNDWAPSVPFQWLACRFTKRVKRGYFTNSWDIINIISQELGYTVTEFLNFRGWSFHRSRKDNTPAMRYHRFDACVKHSKDVDIEKKEALNRHFNSMLAGLFGILKDAYHTFPSSLSRSFEKDFSTHAGFKFRINSHVQVYHLCYAITLMLFKKVAASKKIEIEKLVNDIFGKLRTKRKIFVALNTMLQYFPDEESICSRQVTLLTWLDEPTLIYPKLKSLPLVDAAHVYKAKLSQQIDDLLPQSKVAWVKGVSDNTHLQKKNVAIVRLRVVHLADQAEQYYENSKVSRKHQKLGPGRNQTTSLVSTLATDGQAIPLPQPDILLVPKPVILPFAAIVDDTEPPIQFPILSNDDGSITSCSASSSSTFFSQTLPPTCGSSDAVLGPGCISKRFPSIQVATKKLMNEISCILISEPDNNATIVCQLSPLEVYFHSDLKNIKHRVSYIRDEPNILTLSPSRSVQWVPLSSSVESFGFSVFRQSHALFQKYFVGLDCDFVSILDFLTVYGTTDAARDGEGASVGMRYDFGVGNQCFDTSGMNNRVFHDPPNFDCGMKNLKAHPRSEIILASIGSVADAVQQLFDEHMHKYLRLPRQQNHSFRNSLFSENLCKMLGCLHARYEWFTLLCKCLSAGHYIQNHFDKNNCSLDGYQHTANFSVVLLDSQSLVWRLSILFNQRQAAGDYVNRENGVKQFLSEIQLYLNDIDASYDKFLRDTAVDTIALLPIGWMTYDKLFLCDDSPWKEYSLQKGPFPFVYLVELRAGVSRDLWMSMASHVLRLARKALVKKPELVMELVLIALYQSGWLYFYLTITTMLEQDSECLASDDLKNGDVAYMYYERTTKLFGSFHCGIKTRFNVSSLDFDTIHLKNDETRSNALSSLHDFLGWANMAVGIGSHGLLEKMETVLPLLPGIASFRLQMFLPICGLSGLLSHNLAIVDVVFPAEGRGSHKSLTELGVKEDRFDKYLSLISKHFSIEPHRASWPEMMCCEKRASRQHVTDVFIKGQSLSTIKMDNRGDRHLWVKEYNQQEWRKYTP